MKWANLIHNGLNRGTGSRIVNLGDAFEIIAIDKIYEMMRVHESEIKYIDLYELESYRGEKIILPINFMIAPKVMGVNLLNMSPDIIPVFLGVTFSRINLNQEQLDYLKRWEPVGCRDEYTKKYLIKKGIDAYLGGCLVATLSNNAEKTNLNNKVIFIDVPKKVCQYIPENLKGSIEFMQHEYVASYQSICQDNSYKNKALARIDYYSDNAKMIVTSRFHGAVIGLALGIPVVLTAENNFYKFSWLSKLLPFYDRESFAQINWNPEVVDMTDIKRNMLEIAVNRLKNAWSIYNTAESLSNKLANRFRSDASALRYSNSAIDYISNEWKREENIEYGIWGINDNAEDIYQFIRNSYPNAKLVKVYDGLREVFFHGILSEAPTISNIPDNCFLFVASNTAHKVALELLNKMNKKNYFLCKLEFMNESDLQE